jgi:membrane-associated PAP2 superfamily phosphatase
MSSPTSSGHTRSDLEPAESLKSTLLPTFGLLVLTLLVAELTPFDIWFQDFFFNFQTGRWWVDASAPGPRLFFYVGPKALLILIGLGVIILLISPERVRCAIGAGGRRKELGVVLGVLAIGPALISGLKATTNVFCPAEIIRYGGEVPYARVFDCYPEGQKPARRGRCFPAGHASGGFALFALAGLGRTRRGQRLGFAIGLVAGGWMGGYQIMKGAHYLSHTLVTAMLIWILFLLCNNMIDKLLMRLKRWKDEK